MARKPIEAWDFLCFLFYIAIEYDRFLHREWAKEPNKIRAFSKKILIDPGSQKEKLLAD